MDRGVEVLGDDHYKEKMSPITETLAENVYAVAFDGHSLANECCKGRIKIHRRTITVDKVLRFRLIKNRNIGAPFPFPERYDILSGKLLIGNIIYTRIY